jgi:hypothetical protein
LEKFLRKRIPIFFNPMDKCIEIVYGDKGSSNPRHPHHRHAPPLCRRAKTPPGPPAPRTLYETALLTALPGKTEPTSSRFAQRVALSIRPNLGLCSLLCSDGRAAPSPFLNLRKNWPLNAAHSPLTSISNVYKDAGRNFSRTKPSTAIISYRPSYIRLFSSYRTNHASSD